MRVDLEKNPIRMRYVIAEMAQFQPRYEDQILHEAITFQGSKRIVEFRSLGRGHSEDDAVLLLPKEKIAFIGDIGFFDTQPFLGFCDIERHRKQLQFFQNADYQVLIPGHIPVGNSQEDIELQLNYLDVIENLVGEVVQKGGSFNDAESITLPELFNKWLIGGMSRFETNV